MAVINQDLSRVDRQFRAVAGRAQATSSSAYAIANAATATNNTTEEKLYSSSLTNTSFTPARATENLDTRVLSHALRHCRTALGNSVPSRLPLSQLDVR